VVTSGDSGDSGDRENNGDSGESGDSGDELDLTSLERGVLFQRTALTNLRKKSAFIPSSLTIRGEEQCA
jgi:hypothetical protein